MSDERYIAEVEFTYRLPPLPGMPNMADGVKQTVANTFSASSEKGLVPRIKAHKTRLEQKLGEPVTLEIKRVYKTSQLDPVGLQCWCQ